MHQVFLFYLHTKKTSPAEEPSLYPPRKVYPEIQHLQNGLSRFNFSILSSYSLKSKGQDYLYQPPQPLPSAPTKTQRHLPPPLITCSTAPSIAPDAANPDARLCRGSEQAWWRWLPCSRAAVSSPSLPRRPACYLLWRCLRRDLGGRRAPAAHGTQKSTNHTIAERDHCGSGIHTFGGWWSLRHPHVRRPVRQCRSGACRPPPFYHCRTSSVLLAAPVHL
jgi:hypothetical protein